MFSLNNPRTDFECANQNYKPPNSKYFDVYANGFYLSQMLVSCKFNGVPCSLDSFYYYHDYDYGSCYRFNGGKTNNSTNVNSTKINIEKVQKPGPGL